VNTVNSHQSIYEGTANALEELSNRLVASGFQPLHPSLLYPPNTSNSKLGPPQPLNDRQVASLVAVFTSLLEEQNRKSDIIQELTASLGIVEEKVKFLERREQETSRQHRKESEGDLRIIKDQQVGYNVF
jgi:hypothetical protein